MEASELTDLQQENRARLACKHVALQLSDDELLALVPCLLGTKIPKVNRGYTGALSLGIIREDGSCHELERDGIALAIDERVKAAKL